MTESQCIKKIARAKIGFDPRIKPLSSGNQYAKQRENYPKATPVCQAGEVMETTDFNYSGGKFSIREGDFSGVFYTKFDENEEVKSEIKICAPLWVVARTRDTNSGNWGYLLSWRDGDKRRHDWACPAELFCGDGIDLRRELLSGGLDISPIRKAQGLLSEYILSFPIDARKLCVNKLGWQSGCYVLPGQTIAPKQSKEEFVFQSPGAIEPAFSVAGTVDQWKSNVAALATGNSRVLFAISTAFAGILLDVADMEGGGFHVCGASSRGKSTIQRVSASVFGCPSRYKQTWRTTANGLEAVAALHNDGLLILDEIREINPKEIGSAAYLLANGKGKTRANSAGSTRKQASWRLLFLSSGETGLCDVMQSAGERTHAGQELRLAEISIGDFENTHGYETPGKFADALIENSEKFYGSAGLAFIQRVVAERAALAIKLRKSIDEFVKNAVPPGASGQVGRVAKRFGLVAAAGEIATGFGLTGWPKGEADKAARLCFADWLADFGNGDREALRILKQTQLFFEQHGSSRFINIENASDVTVRVPNQAGFFRLTNNCDATIKTYYVTPQVFEHELCKGVSSRLAKKVLLESGWLIKGTDGKFSHSIRVQGYGVTRLYMFSQKVFAGDETLTTN
jgi:putative DNA primase/helicase